MNVEFKDGFVRMPESHWMEYATRANAYYRALLEIERQDYRGNRPAEQTIAHRVLERFRREEP